MKRCFIQTRQFSKQWDTLGFKIVYTKADKENLSKEECNMLRSLIQTLENSL